LRTLNAPATLAVLDGGRLEDHKGRPKGASISWDKSLYSIPFDFRIPTKESTRPQSSIQTPSHGGHKVLSSVPVPKPQKEWYSHVFITKSLSFNQDEKQFEKLSKYLQPLSLLLTIFEHANAPRLEMFLKPTLSLFPGVSRVSGIPPDLIPILGFHGDFGPPALGSYGLHRVRMFFRA